MPAQPAPVTPQPPVPAAQPHTAQTPTPASASVEKPKRRELRLRLPGWNWRKIVLIAAIILAIAALAGGVAFWLHLRSQRNNPATVFRDALTASLSTTQVQSSTISPTGGSQSDYDFTNITNPVVSSQADVQIYGADFQVQGYGSAQNTFASYAKFPAFISKSIADVAQSSWVQLRANGVEPGTVSGVISNLADPRYQNFGPLMFGNFSATTRERQVNYLLAQHVYAYQLAKVTKTTINNQPVFAYPVTLNIAYLKLFAQSLATSEGFKAAEVQAAVNDLGKYKGAATTLYVSAATHRFVRAVFQQNGQTTTIDYGDYGNASLLAEPETNLTWQSFANIQLQIEQQAAAHESPAALDQTRQSNLSQLHDALAIYYADQGYFPTFANMNNLSWAVANLPGIDPDIFRDPLGATSAITATPTAKSYAYQVITPDGKGCSNDVNAAVSQLCSSYTLSAILSNGQKYAVTGP